MYCRRKERVLALINHIRAEDSSLPDVHLLYDLSEAAGFDDEEQIVLLQSVISRHHGELNRIRSALNATLQPLSRGPLGEWHVMHLDSGGSAEIVVGARMLARFMHVVDGSIMFVFYS